MRYERLFKCVLSLSNALILALYIINYDIGSRLLLKFAYLALLSCIAAIFAVRRSGKIAQYLQNIQITLFSVILLFLFLEFIARLSPDLMPLQIRNYLATANIHKVRSEMVEYLNESPFVKFKPNTIIRSQGYHGTARQFVYEWKTDSLGFKNPAVVSSKRKVDIVALGDSFTEGMGVATDKTWSSVLTEHGYATYNLGVQGYAPIQLEGSLRKYGLNLKPEYVIIGYCTGTFRRQAAFRDIDKAIQNRQFTGGIQLFVNAEVKGEIRGQAKYVVSASYVLARSALLKLYNDNTRAGRARRPRHTKVTNGIYKAYRAGILAIGSETFDMEEVERGSNEWKSTLSAFDGMTRMARQIDAKVILLYLPFREVIYYKAATGKDLPDRYFEKVEAHLLKEYAERNGICFLDPSETLRRYVENLADSITVSELPYLEIDGHLSDVGHQLVANEILGFINKRH